MTPPDLAFAEFLDWCCGRFAKSPSYRRALRREIPAHPTNPNEAYSADIQLRRSA